MTTTPHSIYPITYFSPYATEKDDLARAVEAQGRILLAVIEKMIDDKLSHDDRAEMVNALVGVEGLLADQAELFRDDVEPFVYSDGTPILYLEPVDPEAPAAELTTLSEGFDHLGDYAEHLAKMPLFFARVNMPPSRSHTPGRLAALLRSRDVS